jgi:hypothetical protein
MRGNFSFVIGSITVRTRAVEVRPRKPGPWHTSHNPFCTNSLRRNLLLSMSLKSMRFYLSLFFVTLTPHVFSASESCPKPFLSC